MLGQMMNQPLLISSQIRHAARYHADGEIVSVETAGGVHRTNWGEVERRARRLGSALQGLGLEHSDRVATLAWNNHRHLEIYFGVSGAGLVCHTINPRLFPEQLVYIFNHAEDKVLFIDKTFLPLIEALQDKLPKLEHVYLLSGKDDEAAAKVPGLKFYEDLIEQGNEDFEWPEFDENTASSLCYTSGTTGNPKGALYSHRSTVLHSMAVALPDSLALTARDCLLPVVPMFHVNAWGIPYAAAMVGAKVVLPGPGLDGDSLKNLINGEEVTCAAGVPTLWQGLIGALKKANEKVPSLTRTVIGGSACPPSMIATFRDDYGVDTLHAWGMTEMSPVGSVSTLLHKHMALSPEEQAAIRAKQGRPPFGVDLMIGDEDGNEKPMDGDTQGDLYAKGHWVISEYFNVDTPAPHKQGWFPTGDIATLDPNGILTIKDRSKDVIKSGGEWISSVELENIAMGMDQVADAAVIAAKHAKWDERPLLIVVKAEGQDPSEQDVLAGFEGQVASWQVPDAVVFVDALPRNATGKVLKNKLRDEYENHLLD
ncbi:long-chain-fatty-acid--CoA ligase [Alcanivorax marinus]|uniref:Long-chain-fatty-acid--CoA ligase n=1 Tax=Alloalcanivorax marinus TaxID=1177169 RepID=A0A9Q3UQM5_9GAMM|nr:long-chain-fatty-acid--CoA ligase [Alloalcanivorax marinus]MBM7335251.1 long-chain-fatty-acid--CoA ligase [Alloalcanivorax marinus]MCC4309667.1 long-chain-fatty-acid--CoA ligase [Alloalcanivorax marinus]